MNKVIHMQVLVLVALTLPILSAGQEWDSPRAGNPVLPGYFADPCSRKFGDTYYIYATPDGWDVGKGPFCIWTSKDFVHWTAHESKWPATDFKWAPSVVAKDGKYYMFNSIPCQVWAAVADTPLGPWKNLMEEGKPFIPDQTPKGTITLDGEVFIDDDGQAYLYYGTWGTFTAVKLGPDLRSFQEPPVQFFGEAGKKNGTAPDWFEGPYMFKREGIYYMMYSCAFCQDSSYNVKYVTSRSPMGPWTYDASKNPILETTDDGTVDGPGHHTILQDGGKVYIVYHRHDNPHDPDGAHRQVCAEELRFLPDGSIEKVEAGHAGVGFLAPSTKRDTDLALGRPAVASSSASVSFRPERAFDGNNGTLWKAEVYTYPQWLQVDLGKTGTVKRVETEFQFAQVGYRYVIECSLDGAAWQTFADRRENQAWGPMVDPGEAAARFLRITVLGDNAPHRPHPEIGIWNLRAYDGIDKPNQAPEVEAGPDRTCTMRFPWLNLEGMVHDDGLPDGPVSARWSKADGPGSVEFEHPDRICTLVTFGAAGTYILKLEAADGALSASDAVACTVLPHGDGLIAFGFDEKEGNIACDASGNGQQGVLRGGAQRSFGVEGGAVNLDGRDDFVSCPALGCHAALTIAAWVNPHTLGGDSGLLCGTGPGAAASIAGSGEVRFAAPGIGVAASAFRFAGEALGSWHHVAIVYDGAAKTVSFSIDGAPDAVRTCAEGGALDLGKPLRIGGSGPGLRGLDGELDSFRIEARAFSGAEVAALAGKPAFALIREARGLPDGAPVRLLGKVVTFAPMDPMTHARTTGYFYIGERDGSAGIRVETGAGVLDKALEDSCLSIEGVLKTLASAERAIAISSAPTPGAPRSAPVGTLGPGSQATLVKVAGKVVRLTGDPRGLVLSTEGVEIPVRIEKGPIVRRIAVGDTVEVTGVVSGGGTAESRAILLRDLVRTDPPPAPILALYAFDETDGEAARDSSGSGLDARLMDGPARAEGRKGGALRFDGKKGYLQLPDLGIQTAVTVAAWINLESLGKDDWATSILHCDGWDFGDLHFMIQVKAGVVQASVNGANPGVVESKWSFKGNLGKWVHVATAYDTRAKRFALYVDGKEEASAALWESRPIDLSAAKAGTWGGSARMFHGRMDDLRIYDRALSAAEIASIAAGE